MSSGTFTSQENKGFLWNLLYKNGTFDSFSGDMVGSVKTMFEATIDHVSKSASHGRANMTEQNKEVLIQVTAKCKAMAAGANVKQNLPVTAGQVQQQRQKAFDKSLASRQHEFETSINAVKPTDIDFSDEGDKPIGSEMDALIADAIARRKNDLNVVLQQQDTDAGSKWISKDSETSAPAPARHIQIGEEIGGLQDNAVEELDTQKRVTFNVEETEPETDWLSMLKTKEPSPPPNSVASDVSPELEERLARLEKKMDIILSQMQNLCKTMNVKTQ